MSIYIAAALIALVIVFFKWLDHTVKRDTQRTLDALAAARCPSCGARYGSEVARETREKFFAACAEARASRPTVIVDVARHWPVTCPVCGHMASFHSQKKVLEANA